MAAPTTLRQIRQAFADYVESEGCSCCRNERDHTAAANRLAELLSVPKYEDGSGYDFSKFSTGRRS